MLFTLFIILAVTLFIMTFMAIILSAYSNAYTVSILIVSIITFISAVFTTIELRNPTAIDVYRGRTVLEITYRNGVPIDSAVVFKK